MDWSVFLCGERQGGEQEETSKGFNPPQKNKKLSRPHKNDYSYISFPPTPLHLLNNRRRCCHGNPHPSSGRQSWVLEDEAVCSSSLWRLSESTCDFCGSHVTDGRSCRRPDLIPWLLGVGSSALHHEPSPPDAGAPTDIHSSHHVLVVPGLVRAPLPAGVRFGSGRLRSVSVLPRAWAAGCPQME